MTIKKKPIKKCLQKTVQNTVVETGRVLTNTEGHVLFVFCFSNLVNFAVKNTVNTVKYDVLCKVRRC